ncbi:MAG: NfeD family protein [Thermoanaerobaculia bacterium]
MLGILPAVLAAVSAAQPAKPSPRPERPLVVVCRLESEIHPAAADFVKKAIAHAGEEKAALLVIEISTPGGLMTSMREITTAIVNSKVPVATYVYPSGSRAASAGFFVLLAGDVAAMAPGTNTGAAHPVGGQGEDIPKTMGKKVEQDALAQIRTLCAAHGRDAAAAEKAVTDSVSYTETEAKEKKLIEVIARDPSDLCEKIDGTTVSRTTGGRVELRVRNPRWEILEMGAVERVLGIVSEPNLAYIFFLIGLVGIYFELSHPGAVLPGVAGGISLLLALYAFSVLPVNIAALGLIALGILFIVAEVKFPVHGMLALAGAASFVAGSVLLFAGNAVGYRVRLSLLLPGAVVAAGALAALSIRAAAVRSRPVRTGPEGLIGETGKALTDLSPSGRVLAHGEYWDASAASPIASGSAVRIVGKNGFTLRVEALDREKGDSS